MTVAELIERLNTFDPDLFIWMDSGGNPVPVCEVELVAETKPPVVMLG